MKKQNRKLLGRLADRVVQSTNNVIRSIDETLTFLAQSEARIKALEDARSRQTSQHLKGSP